MKISLFKSAKDSTPTSEVHIQSVIDAIQAGKWKTQIEKVRKAKDKAEKDELKKNLPGFTTSGTFSYRNADQLQQHSGLLLIDIDDVDPEKVKEALKHDRFTSCIFTSCGGKGTAVIVKIDPNKHKESFEKLRSYYWEEYSIKIDTSGSDVSRFRFVSFDENLFQKEGEVFRINVVNKKRILDIASKIVKESSDGMKHKQLLKAATLLGGYIGGGVIDRNEAKDTLVSAIKMKSNVTSVTDAEKTIENGIKHGETKPLYYDEVLDFKKENEHINKACKKVHAIAYEMLKADEDFNDTTIDDVAKEYLVARENVQSIFNRVYKDEEARGINKKPVIFKAEYYIKKNFELRYNIITGMVEVNDEGTWKDLNIDDINRFMQKISVKFGMENIKSLLRSSYVEQFNPFRDYFDNLNSGLTNEIDKLSSYIQTDNQEFWQQQFKKALVRSIACSLDNIENRIIMVLVGEKQSTGKSTFIRFLSPFKGRYYTESPLTDNKDSRFALTENFIYNLEELDSLSRIEVGKLKSIISAASVKERRPYAPTPVALPRVVNFWGSTNKVDFLTDDQNTRWLCFNIISIDWSYKKEVDIHKVWAEAYSLYKSDFDYTLTNSEQNYRDENNKQFEVGSIERDCIIKYIVKSETNTMTNADIIKTLSQKSDLQWNWNINTTSKALSQLGFGKTIKKVDGKTQRVWLAEPNFSWLHENSETPVTFKDPF